MFDWDLGFSIFITKKERESKLDQITHPGALNFNFNFSGGPALRINNFLQDFVQIPKEKVVFLNSKTC